MKSHIESLIANNQIEEAIERLFVIYSAFIKSKPVQDISENYNSLIALSGRFKGILQDQKNGIIRIDDANIEKSKVRVGLISEIKSLPNEIWDFALTLHTDLKTETSEQLTLREQIILSQNKNFEYDVFLSFSSKDISWVKDICHQLRGYGLRVFFSDDSLRLKVGVSFFETIDKALQTSKNFVLVCTPDSMQSNYVRDEYETFYQEFTLNDRVNRMFVIFAGQNFNIELVPLRFKRFQIAFNVNELVDAFVDRQQIEAEDLRRKQIQEAEELRNRIEEQRGAQEEIMRNEALILQQKHQIELEQKLAEEQRLREIAKQEAIDKQLAEESEAQEKLKNEEKIRLRNEELEKRKQEIHQRQLEEQGIREEAEHQLWISVLASNTLAAYNDYLAKYPQGRYVQTARDEVKKLRNALTAKLNSGKAELNPQSHLQQPPENKPPATRSFEESVTVAAKVSSRIKLFIGAGVLVIFCVMLFVKFYSGTTTESLIANGGTDSTKIDNSKHSQSKNYTEQIKNFSMDFIYIPGESFKMGSIENNDEKPIHEVDVKSFYIGKTEVTQQQWKAIMGTNPSNFKNCNTCPVENVTWYDVQLFINKLNQLSGKTYRLPSEAEWELAAGCGKSQPEGSQYMVLFRTQWSGTNSGDELKDYAWYSENSNNITHPVAQKKPNGYGLYDMSGNVWELCQDVYHTNYNDAPDDGKAWENPVSSVRVARGGSWYDYNRYCRTALRYKLNPSSFNYGIGFRLVHSY